MKHNISKPRKNKYFIPTVVVSLLLIVALGLLLFVLFGKNGNTSVSSGNVIGNQSVSVASRRAGGVLSAQPLGIMQRSSDGELTLSWLNGYETDEKFSVSGLIPGDSVSKDYVLSTKSTKMKTLFFELEITNDSLLSKVLLLKVEFDGELAYEGLLKDMPQLSYETENSTSVPCKLTVTMPTHDGEGNPIDNRYAKLSLAVDFAWSMEKAPSIAGGGGYPPFINVGANLVGQKVLEGREWKSGDSFTFKLQYKIGDEPYETIAEKTITSANERIDFSKELKSFSFKYAELYDFRVVEVAGDAEGMQYDVSEKKFQVVITGNKLTVPLSVVSITGEGVDIAYDEDVDFYHITFEFRNKYTEPAPIDPGQPGDPGDTDEPGDDPYIIKDLELTIPVKNTVDSENEDASSEENEYMFVLENVDTGEKTIIRIDKDDNGLGKFELKYTDKDIGETFNYKIYAYNEGIEGVEYSDKVYELKMEVFLNKAENAIDVRAWLDGVLVSPNDIELEFTTVESVVGDDTDDIGGGDDDKDRMDTIIHLPIIFLIISIAELVWFWFIFYARRKAKQAEEENTVKLSAWATPTVFFSLIVPKWEVVFFIVTLCFAVTMLIVDIIVHIKFFPRKKKSEPQDEEKEVNDEE